MVGNCHHHHHHHHYHKHQGLDPLTRSVSRVTAARANASSVFQCFSLLVVCSGMISKGFAFVAFFASEEASSVCIQPKNDLAVAIQSPILSWVEAKNPPQNKYCRESESAIIRCMSALVKATPSSFSSQWLTMTGVFANVSSLLLRREGCLPALPGNSTEFPCLLQGKGYGNTGGMGKLEGVWDWVMVRFQPSSGCCISSRSWEKPFLQCKGS